MATGLDLLHYACQRALCLEYEASAPGRSVNIRRDRNGWLRLRLDGRKTELCMLHASERMERALAPSNRKG